MPFFGGLNNYKIRGSNNYGGTSAAANLSTGVNNLLLGNQAGFSIIAGSQNVLLGTGAGSSEELSNVVGIGYGVIFGAAADGAVIVGNQANGGPVSVVIGDRAGFGATGDPGSNVLIGDFAGVESLNTAINCVLIGGNTYAGGNSVIVLGRDAYGGVGGCIAIGNTTFISDAAGVGTIGIGDSVVAFYGVVIGQGIDNSIGVQAVAIGNNLTLLNPGSTVVIGDNLSDTVEDELGSVILGDGGANPFIYAPTRGMNLPSGTTAERSADTTLARTRFNTTNSEPEIFDPVTDADWRTVVTAIPGAAGASAGTLTNAPAAGNPTAWLSVRVNGVDYRVPAWPG